MGGITGRLLLLAGLALLSAALLAPMAQAATFTVNTLVDGHDASTADSICQTATLGQCTFRAAVEEANAQSSDDTINFSVTGVHPITSAAGGAVAAGLSGGGNLTITGNGEGSNGTVLDAQGAASVSFVLSANNSGANTVSLSSLRVQGINVSGGRGLQANGGTLTLSHVVVTGNTGSAGAGVAASPGGTLNIFDSTISGNTNISGSPGGGIYGGGAVLNLIRSTVSGNASPTGGAGGIYTNTAGSTIVNSTIANNTSTSGSGALRNDTNLLTIRNSTFAGNTSVTGTAIDALGPISLGNSIVTGAAGCSTGGGGSIASAGNNVVIDGSCSPGATDKPNTNPQLNGLFDNGGPTQTMAIYESSPALNAGSASLCAASPVNNVDQRGVIRPQLSGCDIGAFEYAPYIAPNPPPLPSNKFSFGKLKLKPDGRAILPVTVPGPGVLLVHDLKKHKKLILPGDLSPKAAATVRVKLRPTSHGRARFRAGQTVKTTLKVTFTPSGGAPNHEFLGIKLTKK